MCFKKEGSLRLSSPTQGKMLVGYQEGRIFKVKHVDTGKIVGVTFWELREADFSSNSGIHTIYFGPFAVTPSFQSRGVGRLMLAEVDRLAREHKCSGIDINVINIRTDLIAWYESMGYEHTGTSPYPPEAVHKLTRPVHFVNMRKELFSQSTTFETSVENST